MDNNLDEKKLTPEQRAAKAPDAAVQKRTIKDRLLSAFRTGMGKDKKVVAETIRKVDGGYRLVAGSGRNLGTYPTKGGAEKREKQVNYFKHMGEEEKRQVEPPPEAMASDTRIKPLPKKGKRTTGSFNKFGNFTPGMKEEAEQVDENDYSRRRRREEDIISGKKPERKKIPMGSDYAARRRKERLANNGRMDEEMNNRITKIHVRGQNVIVHKYDTEAKGTYKEVKHHSSATAAQTYARQLHKARGGNAELVIEGIEQVAEGIIGKKKPRPPSYSIYHKSGEPASLASFGDKDAAIKYRDEKHPAAEVRLYGPRGKLKQTYEEVEQIDEINKDTVTKYKTKATNVKRALPSLKREFQRKIEKAEALAAQHSPGGKLPRGVGRNPAIATKAREEAAKAKKSLAVFDRWETNRTKGLERAEKRLEEAAGLKRIYLKKNPSNDKVSVHGVDMNGNVNALGRELHIDLARLRARTHAKKHGLTKASEFNYIKEASDLHCPECDANHGKDRENPQDKKCNQCGHKFKNIHGFKNETDNDPEAAAWLKNFKEEVEQIDELSKQRASELSARAKKHQNLGDEAKNKGDFETANRHYNHAGKIYTHITNRSMVATRKNLADMKKMRGELEEGIGAVNRAFGLKPYGVLNPPPKRKPGLITKIKNKIKDKLGIYEAVRKPEHTHAVVRQGNVLSYHKSSKSAHKRADKLDLDYGAVAHSVRRLEPL